MSMRAIFMKPESNHNVVMWEVRNGHRWWTVAFLTKNGQYHIVNDAGREVKSDGVLGRRLIDATKK